MPWLQKALSRQPPFMNWPSTIRTFAIISYFFIFLQGMMIPVPLGCILFFGLFDAPWPNRIFVILADLSLVTLFLLSFCEKTKTTLTLEMIAFFLLLSPLIAVLTQFPLQQFSYFLFLFPASCFVVLFPLSILLSFREYRFSLKTTGG